MQSENKMGVQPVGRLLLSMALPMMLSMIVQALYNVVDSIFVSRLSEAALTAVTLAFPIQSLMIAFGSGLGVGINALLSKSLGQNDREQANQAARHGIVLFVAVYVLFLGIGVLAAHPFMASQTSDAAIAADGAAYLSIVCGFSFGLFGQFLFERLLQSTGRTVYSMITQMVGAIINIILDPILIFGLFGAPRLGVAGAAAATVFGQFCAAVLAVYFNLTRNPDLSLPVRRFRFEPRVLGNILSVGIPSVIMLSISSLMNLGMNAILISFSSTAVAVFGVYFKLQSFVFMPVIGLNNGMVPILAYNFGAGKKERMQKTIKLSIIIAFCIMLLGTVAAQRFPETMLSMFDASDEMLAIGVPALRIISIHFPIAAVSIVFSSVFQALGNGIYSMLVSFCRQLVALLPLAYVFARLGGLDLLWWAFVLAEVVSLVLCLLLFAHTLRKPQWRAIGQRPLAHSA